MEPYYLDERAGIAIILGDCREVLPHVKADVVVTDPPYGIRYSPGAGGNGWTSGRKTFVGRNVVGGDEQDFDPSALLALGLPAIVWGGNHFADRLPPSASWLVWDKRDGRVGNDFADCELAWTNLGGPARLCHHLWCGAFRKSERGVERYHPTQKALAVMSWCLDLAPPGTILDPFMGSGTTLVAAKQLGRQAIGIEIEERYCAIAVKRLAQTELFAAPAAAARAEQLSIGGVK